MILPVFPARFAAAIGKLPPRGCFSPLEGCKRLLRHPFDAREILRGVFGGALLAPAVYDAFEREPPFADG